MRFALILGLSGTLASAGVSQELGGRPLPAEPEAFARATVEVLLRDTAFIQRSVALNLLRRAPSDVQSKASPLLRRALTDPSRLVRSRALAAISALKPEAAAVVLSDVIRIVSNSSDELRRNAIQTLSVLPPTAAAVVAVRAAAADSNEIIRLIAADALARMGETAAGLSVYRDLLRASSAGTRLYAARALAFHSDASGVPVLRTFLADTEFSRWSQAATALGALGPKANAAVPDLVQMLSDTVLRRIPQGRAAWALESRAPYASWALSRVMPFRSSGGGGGILDPVYVFVEGPEHSLRDDGLGVYAWGVDSVAAWRASGFFLVLSPSAIEARGPVGPEGSGFRRSLLFDLSAPIAGSGAQALGQVRDHEAYIWIWYRRDPQTKQVVTFRELSVSDSSHSVERIEMHFRIRGTLHVLQMGPFVEGQGGGALWDTGVHGEGTSRGTVVHPAAAVWIVRAPRGSIARLWSFENRARPIDRGLYSFSLQMRFISLPGGADGGVCVAYPSTCPQMRR